MSSTLKFVNSGADYSASPYGRFEVTPPLILGSALVGWFDAEDVGRRSLLDSFGMPVDDGDKVATWSCLRNSANMTQTTDASRPVFDIDGFNGRPCVTFDGTDDRVFFTGTPAGWPTGTAACELWGIVQSDALDSDTQVRYLFGYGNNSSLSGRSLARARVSLQSRFNVSHGAAGPSGTKQFLSNQWLVMAEFYTESGTQKVGGLENGLALTPENANFNTPTSTVAAVIGARPMTAATLFAPCKINALWVVNRATTAPERTALTAFATGRGLTIP